jgi:hypothetical protein
MGAGTKPLLDSLYRSLDFPDMTVRWDDVHSRGEERGAGTLEFVVAVHVAHSETTCSVDGNNDVA